MAKAKKSVKTKKKVTTKTKKKTTVKRKAKKVLPIPKGYNSIIPYLIMSNAVQAIYFYKKAFGAKQVMRIEQPGGKIGHAELQIGDTKMMLSDECSEMNTRSPDKFNGTPVSIHLYIKNVDAVVKRAIEAGAKLIKPVETMFYGDRCGVIQDPQGHIWCVSTHVEDVTLAQAKKRAAELYGKK